MREISFGLHQASRATAATSTAASSASSGRSNTRTERRRWVHHNDILQTLTEHIRRALTAAASAAAVRTLRRAFARVVVFLDEMIASAECHEMSVVGGRRDRHRTCATNVRVTQLVGQRLQLVRGKMVIIP